MYSSPAPRPDAAPMVRSQSASKERPTQYVSPSNGLSSAHGAISPSDILRAAASATERRIASQAVTSPQPHQPHPSHAVPSRRSSVGAMNPPPKRASSPGTSSSRTLREVRSVLASLPPALRQSPAGPVVPAYANWRAGPNMPQRKSPTRTHETRQSVIHRSPPQGQVRSSSLGTAIPVARTQVRSGSLGTAIPVARTQVRSGSLGTGVVRSPMARVRPAERRTHTPFDTFESSSNRRTSSEQSPTASASRLQPSQAHSSPARRLSSEPLPHRSSSQASHPNVQLRFSALGGRSSTPVPVKSPAAATNPVRDVAHSPPAARSSSAQVARPGWGGGAGSASVPARPSSVTRRPISSTTRVGQNRYAPRVPIRPAHSVYTVTVRQPWLSPVPPLPLKQDRDDVGSEVQYHYCEQTICTPPISEPDGEDLTASDCGDPPTIRALPPSQDGDFDKCSLESDAACSRASSIEVPVLSMRHEIRNSVRIETIEDTEPEIFSGVMYPPVLHDEPEFLDVDLPPYIPSGHHDTNANVDVDPTIGSGSTLWMSGSASVYDSVQIRTQEPPVFPAALSQPKFPVQPPLTPPANRARPALTSPGGQARAYLVSHDSSVPSSPDSPAHSVPPVRSGRRSGGGTLSSVERSSRRNSDMDSCSPTATFPAPPLSPHKADTVTAGAARKIHFSSASPRSKFMDNHSVDVHITHMEDDDGEAQGARAWYAAPPGMIVCELNDFGRMLRPPEDDAPLGQNFDQCYLQCQPICSPLDDGLVSERRGLAVCALTPEACVCLAALLEQCPASEAPVYCFIHGGAKERSVISGILLHELISGSSVPVHSAEGRYGHSMCMVGPYGMIIGGMVASTDTAADSPATSTLIFSTHMIPLEVICMQTPHSVAAASRRFHTCVSLQALGGGDNLPLDLVVVHGGIGPDDCVRGDSFAFVASAAYPEAPDMMELGSWVPIYTSGTAPCPRAYHAACAISCDHSDAVMIVYHGGVDQEGNTLSDCFVLVLEPVRSALKDVKRLIGEWHQIHVSPSQEPLPCRMGHSAVLVYDFIVLIGGSSDSSLSTSIVGSAFAIDTEPILSYIHSSSLHTEPRLIVPYFHINGGDTIVHPRYLFSVVSANTDGTVVGVLGGRGIVGGLDVDLCKSAALRFISM